jgi:low affinity Fe/Cu permease
MPPWQEGSMDHRIVLISVIVAVVAVLGYVLVMRVFFRDSKELDKKIDYSKMKEWKDDE